MLRRRFALATTLLLAPLSAQDAAAPAAPTFDPAVLDQAIERMTRTVGVEFSTFESQENQMTRQMRGMGGDQDVEIDGWTCADLTYAQLNYGEDEIALTNGRMVARKEGGKWKLRRGKLAEGGKLPFVFDPKLFFDVVAEMAPADREVVHAERATFRKSELDVYTVELTGDAAHELGLTGVIPSVGFGGGMIVLGAMGGSPPKAKTDVDIAFWIDPETKDIARVHVKAYQESPFGGAVQFRFEGAGGEELGGDDEAADEVEERDADGNRIYKKGLPVRKVDDSMSMLEFDVRFKGHGKTYTADLDDRAKSLLRMNR